MPAGNTSEDTDGSISAPAKGDCDLLTARRPNATATRIQRYQEWRKSKLERCKSCTKKFCTFLFSQIGIGCLVVAYVAIGGIIFQELESPKESQERINMQRERSRTVHELWNLTVKLNILYRQNWTASADDIMKVFQSKVYHAITTGGWTGSNDDTEDQWTFAGSLLYSITIITTIGYGHITPRTNWGRIVTMFYALPGIPLMFLCLANIGNFLAIMFRFGYIAFTKLCGRAHNRTKEMARARLRRMSTLPGFLGSFQGAPGGPQTDHADTNENHVTPSDGHLALEGTVISRSPSFIRSPSLDVIREEDAGDGGAPKKKELVVIGDGKHGAVLVSAVDWDDRDPEKADIPMTQGVADDSTSDGQLEAEEVSGAEKPEGKVSVPITVSISLIIVYILTGAALFSLWEKENGWDFLIGSYFCFVTLSTIGFGDYVPGTKTDTPAAQEKLIFCALYLLFGLAIICMCFDLMQEEVRNKFRWLGRKIGILEDDPE